MLALTLVAVLAPSSGTGTPPSYGKRVIVVILAVGIVSIPILARITRANTLAWSQREFVTAARAQGASDWRVMFREVLPNVMPAMLSIALLGIAIVIVLEGCARDLRAERARAERVVGQHGLLADQPAQRRTAGVARAIDPDLHHGALAQLPRRRRSQEVRRAGERLVKLRRSKSSGGERFADAPLDGPLLEVDEVKTQFKTARGLVHAVDGVSFTLERGKTIGIVGESGCGKSVLSRSIMGLLPTNVVRYGSILFEGHEIGHADARRDAQPTGARRWRWCSRTR